MQKEYKVGFNIKYNKIDLVLKDGSIVNGIDIKEAINIALEDDLDVVEIHSPEEGKLALCKIMDFGKMMYNKNKKKKSNKNIQHIKEIKCGLNISPHDLSVKHKKIHELIDKRCIVKYVIELRGREKGLLNDAIEKMNRNIEEFIEKCACSQLSISSGRNTAVCVTISPK